MEREDRTETKPTWYGEVDYRMIVDLSSDNEVSPVVTSESEKEDEPESTPEAGLEEPGKREVDGAWLTQVLEAKFLEECTTYDLVPFSQYIRLGSTGINRGRNPEFYFYQEYLRKELFLYSAIDLRNVARVETLAKHNLSVNTVMCKFIQPKAREHELTVLSPTCATLLGLDIMLAAEPRLLRTAQFVDRSIPYLEHLTGSKVQALCCFACSSEKNSQEAYQNTIKDMESELLIIDEAFDEAARCEAGYWPEQEDSCVCDSLLESKAQVDLLMKRFVALFYWPYFLSRVTPRDEDFTAILLEDRKADIQICEKKSKYKKIERPVKRSKLEHQLEIDSQSTPKKRKKKPKEKGQGKQLKISNFMTLCNTRHSFRENSSTKISSTENLSSKNSSTDSD